MGLPYSDRCDSLDKPARYRMLVILDICIKGYLLDCSWEWVSIDWQTAVHTRYWIWNYCLGTVPWLDAQSPYQFHQFYWAFYPTLWYSCAPMTPSLIILSHLYPSVMTLLSFLSQYYPHYYYCYLYVSSIYLYLIVLWVVI